jgi:hypothetical protein
MKPQLAILVLVAALPLVRGADRSRDASASADKQVASCEVTLISDGFTWVSISNTLTPYKYEGAKIITLSPGSYEILGRRKGYRDVRKSIVVKPGMQTSKVKVICDTPS